MADFRLTLACWDYDRTRALMDGRVRPLGVDLTYLPLEMPESFFRMLRYGEFEASEMSMGWYTRTVFRDDRPFIAIPVFPSRMFRHSCVYVNVDSGIREPADIAGKSVGCPEYQMSAAVWLKGIMADHYDVPLTSVTYRTGGLAEPGRRETPLDLPDEIRVEPVRDDQTLSDLLASGEIDALYTAHEPPCFLEGDPRVRRLWPDFASEEQAYFARTGIFPIMHTVVIRWDVYERHRWLPRSLMTAFEEAKALAAADLRETAALRAMLPWLLSHTEATVEVMGDDFWPYGLDANRDALATFLRYSHEQALVPGRLEPEDLFAPETLHRSRI